MAPTTVETTSESPLQLAKITSIKQLAESPELTSISSIYAFAPDPNEQVVSDQDTSIPIIDYSLLVSSSPDQRSKVIHDLGKACREWGFFIVINHGVPESLMKEIIDGCAQFFSLQEEDKLEYSSTQTWDPVRYGTSVNGSMGKVYMWRDYLKVFVHPEFHSPKKPVEFSNVLSDFSNKVREITRKLLGGVSESLGLENNYIDKIMDMESCFQLFAANFYPPCPQPDLAMGIPPHTDHGLLTALIQNGISGLQILHEDKWVTVNGIPNSFLVNVGDHLEILSNGKCKSVKHRAMLNNKDMRISIAMPHGPSLDTVVSPAPELLAKEGEEPAFMGVKYKDYFERQQRDRLNESSLDRVKIRSAQ